MNAKPILLLSVAANVVLAAVLLKTATSSKVPSGAAAPPAAAPAATASASAGAATAPAEPANVIAPSQQFDWRLVESEDYRKYIANLRSIGCPEETIRDIIIADVNKLYESKRKELAGPKKKFEFWKPAGMMGAMIDPERTEKERALNKEKRELLTDLLGSAPDEKPDILAGAAGQIEAMFDFLPTEKRTKVFDLMQDMQGKMQKAMKNGAPDPEDVQKAMKETEAAIAAVLTPEEMLDYNLRFSMTANMMRMQLASFEPSEQEFLELFKMRKSYDDEFGVNTATLAKTEKEKAEAAKKELDAKVKATLGDERYADYERAQDWNFQAIHRVADKNNLTKNDAIKVYDMKKVAEAEARKLRADQSLSKEQRDAALSGIRTETEKGIRAVFGEKAFESYQNQAHWLKGISPDPKPQSTTP